MASRKPPIRWRDKDKKKISVYVRKFNAAVTRMQNQYPELADSGVIPDKLNVSEVRTNITTRNDFNKFLGKVDRFFKPKARDIVLAPSGYRMTRWQIKEAKLTERAINKRRKEFIDKYNIPKGEQKALKLGEINIFKEQQKAYEVGGDMANKRQNWYNFLYTMEKESGDLYYTTLSHKIQQQYINAIKSTFGEEGEALIEFIKDNKINGTDILYAITKNNILDFDFIYSRNESEEKIKQLSDYWVKIYAEIKAEK